MSIIGDIVGTVAKAVLPAVIDAVFPPAALFPGLTNMAANMFGDALGGAIDGALKDLGAPNFLRNTVQDLLKQAVGGVLKNVDPGVADHCHTNFHDPLKGAIGDVMDGLQQIINKWKADMGCKGKGGKGGAGGAGEGGPVTLRDLAKLLGELEAKEAERVKNKVLAANEALSQGDKAIDSKGSKEDQQAALDANTKNRQSQFIAMEDSKAEAQIFQALTSAVAEVMKNFGGALQTASRG